MNIIYLYDDRSVLFIILNRFHSIPCAQMRMSRRYRYGAVPPTSFTYTHAISACRKNSDIESALEFLESARDDGIEPNVYMYSAAIWCCGSDGDKAMELLEEMRNTGCTPNVVSYNGVLSSLALEGRAEEALSLFEELKDNNLKPIRLTFQVRLRMSPRVIESPDTRPLSHFIFSFVTTKCT